MATTIFKEATSGTYAGYETSFTLKEARILATLLGRNLPVDAVEGIVGGSWSGDGWNQTAAIEFVRGKLRLPSCVSNGTHRITRLVWNPETGHLGAICNITDAKGRLLNGDRKLWRDEDGQTRRAPTGKRDFIGGDWRIVGPIDADAVSDEWAHRTNNS